MTKAHQRIIREKMELEESDFFPLFGKYWENINLDIKNSTIKEVSYQAAKKIILKYEWLGTMGTTQIHYGIFFDDYCAGVVCFGFFQAMAGYSNFVGNDYGSKGIQLTRGACVHWAHPHSGSKLIGASLRDLKKRGYKFVVAFSDPEAGEIGTLYQATNWYYLGFGKTKHFNLVYENGKLFMNDRDFNKKYGFKNLSRFLEKNKKIKFKEILPKARYIKLIGSKKENKEMLGVLNNRILPYPKRINMRVKENIGLDKTSQGGLFE
tara:strand:- start:561 stop:1355 length:795 start_codon:yes stop_codon:yes gene_type:complete